MRSFSARRKVSWPNGSSDETTSTLTRGEAEYGDVEFADSTNKKYPIDSPEHIRAAWSYINRADSATKYAKNEVMTIKSRIKRAAKKHGVEIIED